MKVIMFGIAAAAMLAGVGAAPAMAQSSTDFENAAIGLATGCLNAEPTTNPDGVISACSKFVGDMGGLLTQSAPLSAHDTNVDLIVRTMAISRVGRAYAQLDGVRSGRVCQKMEESWGLVSRIDTAASPAYTSMIESLRTSQIEVVGKCRNEQGTPVGAVPLPS